MPGSGAAQNRWDTSNMSSIYNMQNQGLGNYNTFTKGLESGQLDPSLMASVAEHNSTVAAAPDPASAASQQLQNYYESLLTQFGLGIGSAGLGGLAGGLGSSLFGQSPTSGTSGGGWSSNDPGIKDWL